MTGVMKNKVVSKICTKKQKGKSGVWNKNDIGT